MKKINGFGPVFNLNRVGLFIWIMVSFSSCVDKYQIEYELYECSTINGYPIFHEIPFYSNDSNRISLKNITYNNLSLAAFNRSYKPIEFKFDLRFYNTLTSDYFIINSDDKFVLNDTSLCFKLNNETGNYSVTLNYYLNEYYYYNGCYELGNNGYNPNSISKTITILPGPKVK